MTYEEYIAETVKNCRKVLADCSIGELMGIDYLRQILWEDDRVTGVVSGYCTSLEGSAAEKIQGVLFNNEFLADFNEHNLNMQEVMAYGPEAVDIVIRCLALNHINIVQLAEEEHERRMEKERRERNYSFDRV
ncbi:MAG: hypothetical protein SPL61_04055 [Saccharofermentans sp.]|nr:hypothetical protein [Saccharofermentans sp.]